MKVFMIVAFLSIMVIDSFGQNASSPVTDAAHTAQQLYQAGNYKQAMAQCDYVIGAALPYEGTEWAKPYCYNLMGKMYENGQGVYTDCAKAFECYMNATKLEFSYYKGIDNLLRSKDPLCKIDKQKALDQFKELCDNKKEKEPLAAYCLSFHFQKEDDLEAYNNLGLWVKLQDET